MQEKLDSNWNVFFIVEEICYRKKTNKNRYINILNILQIYKRVINKFIWSKNLFENKYFDEMEEN